MLGLASFHSSVCSSRRGSDRPQRHPRPPQPTTRPPTPHAQWTAVNTCDGVSPRRPRQRSRHRCGTPLSQPTAATAHGTRGRGNCLVPARPPSPHSTQKPSPWRPRTADECQVRGPRTPPYPHYPSGGSDVIATAAAAATTAAVAGVLRSKKNATTAAIADGGDTQHRGVPLLPPLPVAVSRGARAPRRRRRHSQAVSHGAGGKPLWRRVPVCLRVLLVNHAVRQKMRNSLRLPCVVRFTGEKRTRRLQYVSTTKTNSHERNGGQCIMASQQHRRKPLKVGSGLTKT